MAAASRDAIQREANNKPDVAIVLAGAAPASGLFWFDRSPSAKHFPLAWTSLSSHERDLLWSRGGKWFKFEWDGSEQQRSVAQQPAANL